MIAKAGSYTTRAEGGALYTINAVTGATYTTSALHCLARSPASHSRQCKQAYSPPYCSTWGWPQNGQRIVFGLSGASTTIGSGAGVGGGGTGGSAALSARSRCPSAPCKNGRACAVQ